MQAAELTKPGVGTLSLHPGNDEGITGEEEIDHWP